MLLDGCFCKFIILFHCLTNLVQQFNDNLNLKLLHSLIIPLQLAKRPRGMFLRTPAETEAPQEENTGENVNMMLYSWMNPVDAQAIFDTKVSDFMLVQWNLLCKSCIFMFSNKCKN